MSRHAQENMASVLLLTVFIGIIWLCQDFGPRARLIPLPLAVAGIVLTLIQFVWHNFGSTEELQIEMISVEAPEMPVVEAPLERITQKKSAWRSVWHGGHTGGNGIHSGIDADRVPVYRGLFPADGLLQSVAEPALRRFVDRFNVPVVRGGAANADVSRVAGAAVQLSRV